MEKLTDIRYVKAVLEKHGFTFSKALGQNFLVNPGVCPKMAAMCGATAEDGVLEIGPGAGVLTRELAHTAKKVVAVELDKRLLPVLEETLAEENNVTVVQGDAMKLDLHELIRREFPEGRVFVCANLPYYITSPMIMRLLEDRLPVQSLTVMVQKEAAQRLCAPPGTRACGAISAAVQFYSQPEMLFSVSAGSFLPPPKVDSEVIRLTLRDKPPVEVTEEAVLFRVVRASFCQRRKTLSNSLSAGLSVPKAQVSSWIERAGLPPSVRAEQLSLQDFAVLAELFRTESQP